MRPIFLTALQRVRSTRIISRHIHFRITVDMTLFAGCNMAALSKVRLKILAAFEKCGKKCWPHSTCAVRKIGRRQKVRYDRTSTLRCDRNTKVRPEMTAFLPMRSLWPHLCTYGMAAISTLSPFSAVLTKPTKQTRDKTC